LLYFFFENQNIYLKSIVFHIFLRYLLVTSITSTQKIGMGFKKTIRSLEFADLALANCVEQNRSIKIMEQISSACTRVQSILLSHYTVRTNQECARAYPPLMLFKCLLLQKCFCYGEEIIAGNHTKRSIQKPF
jgi:hypothetical protein